MNAGTNTGFSAVDDHPDTAALVAALDEQADLPAIRRLRESAIAFLSPSSGDGVIDAGCGTGDMTRLLAATVAPGGTAVGIDTSSTMITEAKRRTIPGSLRLEFRRGDVTRLEFADACFDCSYSERVFQHLKEPEAALAELVRITKPEGRIAVIDTDWGMHAIHGAERRLTDRVVGCWVDHMPNGRSGRRLPALFAAAGMTDTLMTADTITTTHARRPAMEPFATMASVAEHHGALTNAEASRWLSDLAEASAGGTFFWAITLFLVAATLPA